MKKTVTLMFDPNKKLSKLDFMNSMASVVQIIHSDEDVGMIDIQIVDGKNLKKSYPINLV